MLAGKTTKNIKQGKGRIDFEKPRNLAGREVFFSYATWTESREPIGVMWVGETLALFPFCFQIKAFKSFFSLLAIELKRLLFPMQYLARVSAWRTQQCKNTSINELHPSSFARVSQFAEGYNSARSSGPSIFCGE